MKLSDAQERMLHELWPEPDNWENCWYFRSRRHQTTLDVLERLGLVHLDRRDPQAVGAKLTPAGKQRIGVTE